uniref:BTB domain-containing protein n=1 Tax=Meloidogyne hapla TaxID=6305 RepID=A0A1I8BGR5_MELHA
MISNVTKPEVITCKIEWKIFDLKRVAELVQDNQFLSSELYNPKFPSIVCELRIYPHCSRFHLNNKWYDEGAYVSLINVGQGEFLDENICNTIKAKCNIFTFSDGERKNIFSKAFELEGKTESYKHMIGLESIDTSEDGSTLLYCEIDFIPYYNIKPNKSGIENNQSTIRNTSQKTFTNMFEEGTLSDCLIKVGDETIKAHRCILAQNSKVFLRMFEQKGMKEAQKGEIKIVDSSPECFRAMIEYFYSGEITKINFEKLVDDLYVIAHKYEVLTLMDKCE